MLLALSTLALSSCHSAASLYYKAPEYNFAGRPVPPSKLLQRVMIGVSSGGTGGSLQIVDASRDIRSNVEDTIRYFSISGYSSNYPGTIFNFPAETSGFVYSNSDGTLNRINYSTEAAAGPVGTFQSGAGAISVPQSFGHYYGAEENAGVLEVVDNIAGGTYPLNLPNVFKVMANSGDTVALAMVHNSNTLYRVFKLNQSQYATSALATAGTGATDCEPTLLPVYCVVPVPGTYDEPINVYYSLDGTSAYVLNCGPECGGTTASVTVLALGPLNENVIPDVKQPTPTSPQTANIPVPGGVTEALSDGTTLYMAGQKFQSGADGGHFEGFLSTMNQATNVVSSTTYPISDGNHSKMLFADNNTLWIGSQYCATGERAALGLNYNCLTMAKLSESVLAPITSVQILPNVTPGSPTAVVPYPNQNGNQYYYGNLTGICWVQNYKKVYTAYGGQVHVFSTVDGSEIDNEFVTVQGTALDVTYMDALSDGAN